MKIEKFVVLEGIDRSGKSTLSNEIAALLAIKGLKPNDILQLSFPNRNSTTGKLLDSFLKSKLDLKLEAQHLIFSANRWEMSDYIDQARKDGKIIICDRYFYSGIVYSTANGVNYDWTRLADQGLPQPDYVFFIDISPETVSLRKDFGDERYEKLEVQKRIYKTFKEVLKDEKNVFYIDGTKTSKEMAERVVEILLKNSKFCIS